MTLFAAFHVPEKYSSHLAFIDDFGRRSKKASNHSAGGWASDRIVSGSRSGSPVNLPSAKSCNFTGWFGYSPNRGKGLPPCDGPIVAQALESLARGHRDEAI
jgi:hypothetical protein